ncbi:hypothetical protein NL676_005378 [Syzygium grande]|nr:hypothetical protein NL676_005378 [Syzygium grande]
MRTDLRNPWLAPAIRTSLRLATGLIFPVPGEQSDVIAASRHGRAIRMEADGDYDYDYDGHGHAMNMKGYNLFPRPRKKSEVRTLIDFVQRLRPLLH